MKVPKRPFVRREKEKEKEEGKGNEERKNKQKKNKTEKKKIITSKMLRSLWVAHCISIAEPPQILLSIKRTDTIRPISLLLQFYCVYFSL